MFKKTVLPNKLRLIAVPMKETKATTLYVGVKVGSRYEEKEQNGISHFLEHLFFKGTKKRPSTLLISQELDGIGASYNAFTSEEMTGFYIQAESSKFALILDVLYDILQNSLFAQEEIERERGVILEEANMYKDTPLKYIFDLYKLLLYGDTPLGRLIIGQAEQIKSFKREDFLRYKEKFYVPAQIVLAAAGRLEEKSVDKIGQYFGQIPSRPKHEPLPVSAIQKSPRVLLNYKKTDQAHLILGYKSIERASSLRYAQEVLNVILGASMSSRLFTEIRERRGLCYHISSETWYFNDTGSLLVYAGVPIKKTKEAIGLILKELVKVKDKGVTRAELQKAKDYLKGKMALRMESSFNQASFYADQELLLDEIKTPEEELEEIEKVRQEDIIRLTEKIMRPEGLNLAIIGPFKKKREFEALLTQVPRQ
jgi:predicted Zn-dependent peptidase